MTERLTFPHLGLGTVYLRGEECAGIVDEAIASGYRLIDTAYNYENEGAVGLGIRRALARTEVDRDEIIVSTKLAGRYHERPLADRAIEESAARLGLGAIDLLLIHWPNPHAGRFTEAWAALLDARERGLVKHLGVSNFLPEHIEELHSISAELPEVNQLEIHPMFPQDEVLAWHRDNGIAVEAWSPLGRGELLNHPTLQGLAQEQGTGVAELLLAWHHTRGAIPLPRTSQADRLVGNMEAAERILDEEAVRIISRISEGHPHRLWDQDPAEYEEF